MINEESREHQNLGLVDLTIAVIGIVILYIGIGFVSAQMATYFEHEKTYLYVSGFMTQGVFALILWFLIRFRKRTWSDFGWRRAEKEGLLLTVFKVYILTLVVNLIYGIYLFQKGYTLPESDIYAKLFQNMDALGFVISLFLAGIVAPVFEETLFRGVIFGSLQANFGKLTSAVISSIIFSGLHFQLYGFFPRFVLGVVLVYLYQKYNTLYPAIFMHALNNTVAIALIALVD